MRIAIGGFHHETNTFAPTKAGYEDFARAAGWPGLSRGAELIPAITGINIPSDGFVKVARAAGHDLVPLVWCNASPSAHVTEDAYERIAGMMLQDLAAAGRVDAVYLDLHGAMVPEHLEDGEGELIRRVRGLVGPDVIIVGSLDLHANVTPQMIDGADLLDAYRTYPHIDMSETGARVAHILERIFAEGRPAKSFRQLDFLIPINWQCTMIEPAASLYRRLASLATGKVFGVSFTPGFPPADIHHCGPAVFAYGADQAAADSAANTLASAVEGREGDFAGRCWQPDEAVAEARSRAATATRPVILADTQDNPGGGGDGDTTGVLAALVRAGAEGAVLGLLVDPAVAEQAHAAGEGATIEASLGGKSGVAGDAPLVGRYRVEKLGSGQFTGTGPFYGGSRMNLGPMALLRCEAAPGVRVVLCCRKVQAADQAMFRHLGVEPAATKILALKSSVHFRADFEPIAEDILVVLAPGPVVALPADLPYVNLRPGVRLGPLGVPFAPRQGA
ncbi:microcystin degradation protein MlrC [Constrictibacter sp. MBR-5]|jgi:microcystin degradation protein MlrC|uniref:M81 family metallopeptidase n=1 Tax=Constrictibacter sp. MBR-5 TaxID=3156467 RepID=UPI0033953B9A